jgi:hypothetical protein
LRHHALWPKELPSLLERDLDLYLPSDTQTSADQSPQVSIATFQAKAADHAAQCLGAARAAHPEPEEKGAKEGVEREMVEELVDQGRPRRNLTQRWRTIGAVEEQRRTETLGLMLLPKRRAISRWLNRYRFMTLLDVIVLVSLPKEQKRAPLFSKSQINMSIT